MISLLNHKVPVWVHALSVFVVVLIVSASFNSHVLAWLIGGAFMGFSSQLAFVAPANRSVRRFVLASLSGGIAASLTVELYESIA